MIPSSDEHWNRVKRILDPNRPPDDLSLYVEPLQSPAARIAEEIQRDPLLRVKRLLVGGRGGGKSTQLRKIRKHLTSERAVVEIDLDLSNIPANSVTAADLVYLSALGLIGLLKKALGEGEANQAEALYDRLKEVYAPNEAERSQLGTLAEELGGLAPFAMAAGAAATALGGIGAPALAAGAVAHGVGRFLRLISRSDVVLSDVSPQGRGLIDTANHIADAVFRATGGVPCVMIDGLERMNGESAERFNLVFEQTSLLSSCHWNAVIACPPAALTETNSAHGRGYFVHTVWGFPLEDAAPLARMLRLRFEREGIRVDPALLDRISQSSGGIPRHAITIANRACEHARFARSPTLTEAAVTEAIDGQGQALALGLDIEDFELLARVLETGMLPRGAEAGKLFSDGRIIALPPEGKARRPRYAVHPLLKYDVEDFSRSRP
jgi:hypothetical protein